MRGHLRQRKPGTWELVGELGRDPLTGRRRQRSRTFHGTKREAERELRALLGDIECGRLTGSGTSVGDLLDRWLELAADQLSPTTLREYRRLVDKRIGPAVGDVPLTKLTTPELDDFYRALTDEGGLSPASVRQIHSIIRRGLKQGVKWGWIQHNPAVNATPPRVRHRRVVPPSLEQVRQLVEAAQRHGAWFGVLVRLAFSTGIRRGEICGLQWPDVDLGRGQLHVVRSVAAIPGGAATKSTKTGRSRKLAIDGVTMDLLEGHRDAMTARARECGTELALGAFVFSHAADGTTPVHPDNVTAAFRRLPANDGVRFHDLRHAHATQLLAHGVDIATVSSRLGHANSSTTLDIYAHVLDANDRNAADMIGELPADERSANRGDR